MADPEPAAVDSAQFVERPTEFVVRDAFALGAVPLALAGALGLLGWTAAGFCLLGLTVFVACFFRNPPREIAGGENSVVAPADGRVIDVAQIEGPDGNKWLRIGIFLSVLNVHVNRCPLAGRVVGKDWGGQAFLAAFNPRAEAENVRCALTLETAAGLRFQVVQITGLIARRIVCHPQLGEWEHTERKRVADDELGRPLDELRGVDRCGFGVRHFSSSSGRPGATPSTTA